MSTPVTRPTPLELLRGVLALGLVVVGFLALERFGLGSRHGGPLFALGFLVLAGTVGGSLAAFFGQPRLTGYIVAGLMAGPEGFGVIAASELESLALINGLALALIALQAGAELTMPVLRRTWKSVGISSIAQIAIVIPAMAVVFWFAAPFIPATRGQPTAVLVGLGVLWGAIAFVRSPAVTLAVLSEMRAKGPLTDWSLGVVVLLDVLILPLFAVALGIARTQVLGDTFDPSALVGLGHELFASMAAGITFGLLIGVLFRFVTTERVLLLVVLGYGVTALTGYLHYDTLVVFVAAGSVASNLTRAGPGLIATSEQTSSAVMIVFFATAGAKLDLVALRELWPVVLALFLARVLFTWISARVGHRLAGDPKAVRDSGWLVLVSQAGVAIGLATIMADALPGVGPPLASLVVAVVALNTLSGAGLMKWAISRAGEQGGGADAQEGPGQSTAT